MDSPGFGQLFAALRGTPLQPVEREQLRAWLATINDAADCVTLIEQAAVGKCCPRCGGARAHRCGRASDLQRWRCLACGRSYNALSGTSLAHLRHKEHWLACSACSNRAPCAPAPRQSRYTEQPVFAGVTAWSPVLSMRDQGA